MVKDKWEVPEDEWNLSNAKWKERIAEITDPTKMLEAIIANEAVLGYDPYYADLRNALLDQAQKVINDGHTD